MTFYVGVTTTMIELILAGFPYHATGQLKVLKRTLRNLTPNAPKIERTSRIRFKNVEKVLRECILLHNKILQ